MCDMINIAVTQSDVGCLGRTLGCWSGRKSTINNNPRGLDLFWLHILGLDFFPPCSFVLINPKFTSLFSSISNLLSYFQQFSGRIRDVTTNSTCVKRIAYSSFPWGSPSHVPIYSFPIESMVSHLFLFKGMTSRARVQTPVQPFINDNVSGLLNVSTCQFPWLYNEVIIAPISWGVVKIKRVSL